MPDIPTMTDAELYSKSLAELIELRNDFARFKWELRLDGADDATKQNFSTLRGAVEDRIRALANLQLAAIAADLQANEASLSQGIQDSENARTHFDNIANAFKAFSAFLNIVGTLAKVAGKVALI